MVDDPTDLRSARVVHERADSQPRQRSSWSSSAEVDGKQDLGAEGTDLVDRSDRFVILRHATDDDAEALNSFDVGDTSIPWLAEVAEIVAGLLGWRSDPAATDEDRQVVIAERDGELVAVAAHVRLVGADGRSMPDHRYLMVTAVRADQQRTGLAQRLVETVLVDLRSQGVASVEWLVHPGNAASIAFSRAVFPEADETKPPHDAPYVSFALSL